MVKTSCGMCYGTCTVDVKVEDGIVVGVEGDPDSPQGYGNICAKGISSPMMLGYAAGPADVIKAMTNIQSKSTSNPNSITQKAAVEALTGPQDFIYMMVKEFDKRRRYIVGELSAVSGITCAMPSGAFYAFPNTSVIYGRRFGDKKISSSGDLALYLLEEAKVALVPGEAFGDDDYVRLSYATSMQDIRRGLERIREAVSRLEAPA